MSIDTKTALLNAAEHAARTRGFDGFSYADLAASVGIRKASIHHHFPTKAALCTALMRRYAGELKEACADIDAASTTGAARLSALIDRYRAAIDGGKSLCLCVSFSTSRESLPAEVIAEIGRFRKMLVTWLTGVFELGQADATISAVMEPAREAKATLALLEGAQLAARAQEDAALFEQALHLLRDRISRPQ